jgi:hypothetical protein
MQESREVSAADFQFTKSALTFYIEAARHALPVANLPQFADCILAIERFRDFPNPDTHEGMVEQYWMLRGNEHLYNRAFAAISPFVMSRRGLWCERTTTFRAKSLGGW